MSDGDAVYNEIADTLVRTGQVKVSKMFGMPCLTANGYTFAMLSEGEMVFKLKAGSLERALALDGALNFVMHGGRPMKEWVKVPVAHSGEWPALADEALAYVRELPPKKPKKRGKK